MTLPSPLMCSVSGETPSEERLNYLTHLGGLLLSFIGLFILIKEAWTTPPSLVALSSAVYGTTLILLYAISTLYHGCKKVEHKRLLRVTDHVCIYLLIAGSYTPFSLGPLRQSGGIFLLTLIWAVAFLGILLKIFAFHRFQTLSLFLYLGMGWLIVYNLPILVDNLSSEGVWWLIAGGVIYSVGTLFYIWHRLVYSHAVWHLFVMGGSICHFFSILEVVKQAATP